MPMLRLVAYSRANPIYARIRPRPTKEGFDGSRLVDGDGGDYRAVSATPWSMWQLWNVPFVGELWVSNRTRQMVDRVKITRYGQTCRRHCPPGYRPYGDPPTGCEWWNPDDPTHAPWADPIHTVSRTAHVETQEHRWTKYEWRTRTDNPYWAALQLILSSGGALLHVGAKKGAGGLTAAPLPGLVAGERLIVGKANSDFSMVIDGIEHQPGKAIVLEKLGLGSHLIELSGKHPKLGKGYGPTPAHRHRSPRRTGSALDQDRSHRGRKRGVRPSAYH